MSTQNINWQPGGFSLLTDVDSYKASHYLQYPPGTEYVSSYIEARGGDFDTMLFFGLQAYLKKYLSRAITLAEIDYAEELWQAHGVPFNRDGWLHVLDKHNGVLPLGIKAVREGTVLPIKNAVVQVENTDPAVPWLTSYIETALLRAVWYPTTVATLSWSVKQIIGKYLKQTCVNPEAELPFKLHDFGARGATSYEAASLGGLAHLVNFQGTDTVGALLAARKFYGADMAGFSIPASEHSTMTAWGRTGETRAYENMVEQFGGKDKVFAVVSDSYDLFAAVKNIWGGTLKQKVMDNGGTLVVRPDSGNPIKVCVDVVESLGDIFGYTINTRGYKVLPPYIRVIQGDGVHALSIEAILQRLKKKGWSAENIAFGMGGALLQRDIHRDTMNWAMKANAIKFKGDSEWTDVYKDPITDPGKISKRGRQALVMESGTYKTIRNSELGGADNLLEDVWRDGELLRDQTLDEIRALSEI
ncbi:MAG: nicotinate phosphoribosyltransferase [Robiginitomaculum sp.]|nr:nicotinate phosphoribosyltransferase [Robiginitomaculum sp.]